MLEPSETFYSEPRSWGNSQYGPPEPEPEPSNFSRLRIPDYYAIIFSRHGK